MPSTLVPRGGRVGARLTVGGRQEWLGTFDSREAAREAVLAARSRPVRKVPKRKPARRRPPSMATCDLLAAAMPSPVLSTFVLVAAWSGLRLSEVAALEARDVAWDIDGGAVLHVRHGKGPGPEGKEGWSVLFPRGADALRVQLLRAPARDGRPVLLNAFGRPWDRKSVNKAWCRARATVPGQEAVTFHALRKAHASWLLDQGASDIDVAVQLRHIDSLGRPDPSLVREVYGFPAIDAALGRIREVGR